VNIMKTLVCAWLVFSALTVPVCALAQSTEAPVTRAEVRADLVRFEQAGYRPWGNNNDYPDNIQRAEAVVAKQDALANTAVGGAVLSGSSASGTPVVADVNGRSIYAGH
jgi:hypothetical protein